MELEKHYTNRSGWLRAAVLGANDGILSTTSIAIGVAYALALLLAIIRIVPQKQMAEDILEKAFIKIWNSFDFYPTEKERLFTWMVMTARDTAKEAERAGLDRKHLNVKDCSKNS